MLYRNGDDHSTNGTNQSSQLIELIIAKQRNGPIGIVKLKFDKKRNKFFSLE
jgi:replicative DNA helicase